MSGSPKSPQSDVIISTLQDAGGWGTGSLRIDFGLTLLSAENSTPMTPFQATDEFYSPDCDEVPFPLPLGGSVEGEPDYECSGDGDCHLLVVHEPSQKLYEMWRANVSEGVFYGGCAAVWDLDKEYPENLRGDGCTSADAGGFPVASLSFSSDEVASGEISHAIRFILPNNRIREKTYVHPGTHTTNATSGSSTAPPYGVRFRLRADYPLETLPTEGARVIAKGMQQYGMFLADAGQIALTALSDKNTAHTWADVGVDAHSLSDIQVTDMEVVELGQTFTTQDCNRN